MRFLLILPLWLSFSSASAGIRVINNGGGDGEMIALSALALSPEIIGFCVRHREECGLDEGSALRWSALLDKVGFDVSKAQIEFFSDGPIEFRKKTAEPKYLGIHSQLLYDVDGKAKSFQQILTIVVAGWLSRLHLSGPLPLHFLRAVKIGFGTYTADFGGTVTVFHVGQKPNTKFHIDWKSGVEDISLNDKIVESLTCRGIARLKSLERPHWDQKVFLATVKWACDGDHFQGQLVFDPGEKSVRILGRSQVTCEAGLQ